MNIDIMGGDTGFNAANIRYRPGRTANQVHYRSTFWRKQFEKVVLIDGKADLGGNVYATYWYYLWESQAAAAPPDDIGRAQFRHTKGINALFLDGHAEWTSRPT